MPVHSLARGTEAKSCGRKRAYPTSSRRTWKIVSAVTLSASLVSTIAFQQSSPLNQFTTRSSTALNVLADPRNIVKIESKQSVEDRAALEELYLLSALAKKATKKRSLDEDMGSSAQLESSDVGAVEHEQNSRSSSIKVPKSTISKATTISTIDDGATTETIHKELSEQVANGDDSSSKSSSKKVAFKGLTTVPNPRNMKKKVIPLIGTLSERLAMSEDEYIENILQKKEELLAMQSDDGFESTAAIGDTLPQAKSLASEYTTIPKSNAKRPNFVESSRSSTMPGFLDRRTDRTKAIADGRKIAERNSRIEFVETPKSKKRQARANGQSMYKASTSVPDSLVHFANEIHHVERITREEEIQLGELTQEALRVQDVYDNLVTKLKREPTDDEWCAASGKFNMEALTQIIDEGMAAKNKLVASNLRIVQGVVNVYIKNGIQEQYNAGDMMQEGIIALIRAAEKFDPSKGFRFSTYAMYWIRAAVKRDHSFQSRIVRVPQRLHETHKKISQTRKTLETELSRKPTPEELSKEVGITVEQLEKCEDAFAQKMISLDQQMNNKNRNYSKEQRKDDFHSITSSRPTIDCSDSELMQLREDLLRSLDIHLTEEQATLIKLKFGLDEKCASTKKAGRTFQEVSEMVGMKREKVRRLVLSGLKRLENTVGDELRYYNRDIII